MPNGKALGPDGFIVDFYILFFFTYSIEKNSLYIHLM
jgi:hypothetical protein